MKNKEKPKVVLEYTEEEAGLLCEILQFASDELMSLYSKCCRSKDPLLDAEEKAYLVGAVKFCAEQVFALFNIHN